MNSKTKHRFVPFALLLVGAWLLLACGPCGWLPISRSPSPTPAAVPTAQPVPSLTVQATSPGEEAPHPIYDIGQDETWDGRPMAYLMTDLATPDPRAAEFEEQLRWGYGLLAERYHAVEVLELQLLWQGEYAFFLGAAVEDWNGLVVGQTTWAEFWQRLEKTGMGTETEKLYEDEQVVALLEELAGDLVASPVESPTATADQLAAATLTPTRFSIIITPIMTYPAVTPTPTGSFALPLGTPTPTRGPDLPVATPAVSLDATYEDPEGFFALDYPADWTPHRSGSEMQFWADAQGDSALAISIQIKALSAQAVVDDISALLAGKWDDYRVIDSGNMTLSGYPAVWVEQTYRLGGVPYYGAMLGVVRNRVGYLLLAWAPEAEYGTLEPAFLAIANSLRLTEFTDAPPYDQWPTHQSAHFVFHYLPNTYVARDIETIAADHEWAFGEIVRSLGVAYDGPIHFYLYPSEEALYRATARDAGFAINEGHEVHSLWISAQDHQSLGHEMTHVITSWTLGEPSEALLGEGIAVCMDHSGKDHHAIAADVLRAGELTPPSQLLGDAWFEYQWAYPVSGSFVCFLLEGYSMERFEALYPRTDFAAALQQIYGVDLTTLEEGWLDVLRKR